MQIPGTDIEIDAPKGFVVDEIGQGLKCSSSLSLDCGRESLAVYWWKVDADDHARTVLDEQVAEAAANGIRNYPLDIKRTDIAGMPASEFELPVSLEGGDKVHLVQIWLARGDRRIDIEIKVPTERSAAFGALVEAARRIRFTDSMSSRKLGWTVPPSIGFFMQRSTPFAEFFGPSEQPKEGEPRVEVHLGCTTGDASGSSQEEIREAAIASARRQGVEPQQVGAIDVGGKRAVEIIGPRITSSDPRTAWYAIVPQRRSIVTLFAVHKGERSDDLVTRYRAFARDLRVDGDQLTVPCEGTAQNIVPGSLGR